MPDVTIATWNVNSVRPRVGTALAYLRERRPDILCLQEIKATEDVFPFEPFRAAGWGHVAMAGFKGYNGVATLSRIPFARSGSTDWCGRRDGRHVWTEFEGGVELHNFYVPAGGAEPDPAINDKFAHKLDFLAAMTDWCARIADPRARRILVGDLNVAPLECDVWSHKRLLKEVSHTPVEIEAMERLRRAHDWTDAVRRFRPAPEKLYSWWSYRARDWAASDRGRRLDHVWVAPALAGRLKSADIHRHVRGWDKASDHCPVSATLDLPA